MFDGFVFSDRRNSSQDKRDLQLKFYEEYVNELECRLKGFIQYMITDQRLDEKYTSVRHGRMRNIFNGFRNGKHSRTGYDWNGFLKELSSWK